MKTWKELFEEHEKEVDMRVKAIYYVILGADWEKIIRHDKYFALCFGGDYLFNMTGEEALKELTDRLLNEQY